MESFAGGRMPVVIFCDGACSGNPGRGGWGAIVVRPGGEVRELGAGDLETTNNKMELTGAIAALEAVASEPGAVHLYTDSVYVIKGITQWIWGWRSRGWKTAEGADVANQELWQRLLAVVTRRGKDGKVEWKWVKGHSGVPGNERCDEIAVGFTKGQRVSLYSGPLLQYGVAVLDLPEDRAVPDPKDRVEKKAAAFSYLSVVDGVPQRHKTWAECERRVKGRSGAKFKKATSQSEEVSILSGWGFSAGDVR